LKSLVFQINTLEWLGFGYLILILHQARNFCEFATIDAARVFLQKRWGSKSTPWSGEALSP